MIASLYALSLLSGGLWFIAVCALVLILYQYAWQLVLAALAFPCFMLGVRRAQYEHLKNGGFLDFLKTSKNN